MAYRLQPIVQQVSSYIKDASDFLRKISTCFVIEIIPDNSYLVTQDVRSLNSECIKAVKTSLENVPERAVATKVITTFLSLILMLNNFMFNCKNYLQIKGCVMGTICPPAYANTFMNHCERKHIYSFLEGFSLNYLSFMMFFIWTGSKNCLLSFLNDLNAKYNSVKFECKVSQSSILFLVWKFISKTTNYKQKFILRKQTSKIFYILIGNTPYN